MVADGDALASARALLDGLELSHLIEPGRELRRKMTPQRSAKPGAVTIAALDGAVWLDVPNQAGGAGVLFTADEWAGFCASAVAALFRVVEASHPVATVQTEGTPG